MRRGVARDHAQRLELVVGHGPQRAAAEDVGELDLVDLEVAAQHGEDRLGRFVAAVAATLGRVEDGLRGLRGRDAEQRRERLDGRRVGGGDLLDRQRLLGLGGGRTNSAFSVLAA